MGELCEGQKNGRQAVVLVRTMFDGLYQKIELDDTSIRRITRGLVDVMPDFEIPTGGKVDCELACSECDEPPRLIYDYDDEAVLVMCTTACKNQIGLSMYDWSVPFDEIFPPESPGQQG